MTEVSAQAGAHGRPPFLFSVDLEDVRTMVPDGDRLRDGVTPAVERFLRLTANEPDRGHPITPVAFLVDYAHGWEPSPIWPNSFKNWHRHDDRFLYGDHEKMLEQYFWTAFHPIGPESEKPITAHLLDA